MGTKCGALAPLPLGRMPIRKRSLDAMGSLPDSGLPMKRNRHDSIQSIGSVDFLSNSDLMREGFCGPNGEMLGVPNDSLIADENWGVLNPLAGSSLLNDAVVPQSNVHSMNSHHNHQLPQLDAELKGSGLLDMGMPYGALMGGMPRTPRSFGPGGIVDLQTTPSSSSGVYMASGNNRYQPNPVSLNDLYTRPIDEEMVCAIMNINNSTTKKNRKTKTQGRRQTTKFKNKHSLQKIVGKKTNLKFKAEKTSRTSKGLGKHVASRAWRPAGYVRISPEIDDDDCEFVNGPNGPVRRERKNNREKRRRQAMNDRFDELTDVLLEDLQNEYLQKKTKWNKADVLAEAIKSIKGLRQQLTTLKHEESFSDRAQI